MPDSRFVTKLLALAVFVLFAHTGVSEAGTRTVTVAKAGNGSGGVVSSPAGISCGASCSASFNDGAIVTLNATPDAGRRLKSFSGTPCYRIGNTCQVVIWGDNVSITATFVQVLPLTVNIAGSGTGRVTSSPAGTDCTATCTADHETGTTVTLTAAPQTWSRFAGWSGGACSGSGTCEVSMDAAKSVTATFTAVRQLRVEVPTDPSGNRGGRISSTPAGIDSCTFCAWNFDLGQTVKLTATPDPGWEFADWSGDRCSGVGTSTCDVQIDWAAGVKPIVRASFVRRSTLTVAKVGSGTVTSDPAAIDCGATCTTSLLASQHISLHAQAAAGWRFASWTGCTSGAFSDRCDHNQRSDTTVTANFIKGEPLTVTLAGTGNGTVSSSPGGISCPDVCSAGYDAGTTVTLRAQSGGGVSSFAGWSGACQGTAVTCDVAMTEARNVTATFNATRLTLTVEKVGGGTGTVRSEPASINCGSTCSFLFDTASTVKLNATAGPNSLFAGWSGGGCSGTGACEVTMDAAKTVTARFDPGSTLTVVLQGFGSGTVEALPSGSACTSRTCTIVHPPGTEVTLTATPQPGTIFAYWFGGGCDWSTSRTCTVTLNGDTTVSADFYKVHTVTVNRTGDGFGIVTGQPWTGIDCGATCTTRLVEGSSPVLTATPYAGSKFVGWSGGGQFCGTNPECVPPMYEDWTLTAMFVKDALASDPDPSPSPDPSPGGSTPTPGASTPTPGGSTPTPGGSTPTPTTKIRVTATGKRRGRSVKLTLQFRGAPSGTTPVTVRLLSGKRVLAKASGSIRSSRAQLTLRAKKAVRKGSYRVQVTVRTTKLASVNLRLR